MTRSGKVFIFNKFEGVLEESSDGGFRFQYSPSYLAKKSFLSFSNFRMMLAESLRGIWRARKLASMKWYVVLALVPLCLPKSSEEKAILPWQLLRILRDQRWVD